MKTLIDYFKKAYSGGLLKQGRFAVHEAKELYISLSDKVTSRVVLDTDTNWIDAELLNGWETYDETVSYRVDSLNVLHIKGTARYGALNYPIFQLPNSVKITRNISLVVLMRDGHGRLDINDDGYVIPRGTGGVAYLSLETRVIL